MENRIIDILNEKNMADMKSVFIKNLQKKEYDDTNLNMIYSSLIHENIGYAKLLIDGHVTLG